MLLPSVVIALSQIVILCKHTRMVSHMRSDEANNESCCCPLQAHTRSIEDKNCDSRSLRLDASCSVKGWRLFARDRVYILSSIDVLMLAAVLTG